MLIVCLWERVNMTGKTQLFLSRKGPDMVVEESEWVNSQHSGCYNSLVYTANVFCCSIIIILLSLYVMMWYVHIIDWTQSIHTVTSMTTVWRWQKEKEKEKRRKRKRKKKENKKEKEKEKMEREEEGERNLPAEWGCPCMGLQRYMSFEYAFLNRQGSRLLCFRRGKGQFCQ